MMQAELEPFFDSLGSRAPTSLPHLIDMLRDYGIDNAVIHDNYDTIAEWYNSNSFQQYTRLINHVGMNSPIWTFNSVGLDREGLITLRPAIAMLEAVRRGADAPVTDDSSGQNEYIYFSP